MTQRDIQPAAPPGEAPSGSGARRSVEAAIVASSQALSLALTFAIGVVTARLFAPELRGEYGMFVTVASFAAVFTTFGLPEAIVYFHRRGEADRARVATSIALAVLVASGLVLASTPLAPLLAGRFFPAAGVPLVALGLASGVATVLLRNVSAYLQAQQRFLAVALCNVMRPLSFLLALGWIWLGGADLLETGVWYLVTHALVGLAAFAPLAGQVRAAAIDGGYLSKLSNFSIKSYAQAIVNQLNYRLDMFIVAYLVGDMADVAYYHIAAGLAALLWVVPDSYGQVIYPRMAGYTRERERSAETVMGVRYVFAIVLVGCGVVALAAPWVIPLLFGDAYALSVPLLLILLPGTLAMAVSKILTRYFISRNRHQLNSVWILAAVAVGVALNFALIPRIGVQGAALAATIAYVVMAAGLMSAFLAAGETRRSDWLEFPAREIRTARGLLRSAAARLRGGS